ncbi:hypothetical protein Tco_1024614 [Tanacetum coccineum]
MYVTASSPDLVFAICMCARYQAKPTEKHLIVVKRVFWYLKGTINMGLWYLRDIGFNLTVFADADHAGCQDSRKTRFLCTPNPRAPSPYLATLCNTPGRNTSMFTTILSKSKLKTRLLSYTLLRQIINWQISSLKHSWENASNS